MARAPERFLAALGVLLAAHRAHAQTAWRRVDVTVAGCDGRTADAVTPRAPDLERMQLTLATRGDVAISLTCRGRVALCVRCRLAGASAPRCVGSQDRAVDDRVLRQLVVALLERELRECVPGRPVPPPTRRDAGVDAPAPMDAGETDLDAAAPRDAEYGEVAEQPPEDSTDAAGATPDGGPVDGGTAPDVETAPRPDGLSPPPRWMLFVSGQQLYIASQNEVFLGAGAVVQREGWPWHRGALEVSLDALFGGRPVSARGAFRAALLGGAAVYYVRFRPTTAISLGLGAGARGGAVEIEGESDDPAGVVGSGAAFWWGPMVAARLDGRVGAFGASLRVDAGYVARGARATALCGEEGAPVPCAETDTFAVRGPWLGVVLGAGWAR